MVAHKIHAIIRMHVALFYMESNAARVFKASYSIIIDLLFLRKMPPS
jgi:hypothetical protein